MSKSLFFGLEYVVPVLRNVNFGSSLLCSYIFIPGFCIMVNLHLSVSVHTISTDVLYCLKHKMKPIHLVVLFPKVPKRIRQSLKLHRRVEHRRYPKKVGRFMNCSFVLVHSDKVSPKIEMQFVSRVFHVFHEFLLNFVGARF